MNFLDYTKKLIEQITYYDTITKNKYNPFSSPIQITIIWVDDVDN